MRMLSTLRHSNAPVPARCVERACPFLAQPESDRCKQHDAMRDEPVLFEGVSLTRLTMNQWEEIMAAAEDGAGSIQAGEQTDDAL